MEAQSWKLKSIMKMARVEGVQTIYGMGRRWMTNSEEVAEMLIKMIEAYERWHLRKLGEA